MALTSSQAATLKAAVTSDATVAGALSAHDWFSIAGNYNVPSTNLIWRADVTPAQVQSAIAGSEAVKQSPQQLQLAQLLLTSPFVDASNSTVRAQFGAIFPASSAGSTSANLTTIAQRFSTKFEQLFVTSQVTTVYAYVLSPADVQNAMGF